MDLGLQSKSPADTIESVLTLHREVFFTSPIQANSAYLSAREGEAMAQGISREEEKFLLLFSGENGPLKYLKRSVRRETIDLMRELIGYYRGKFETKDPTAFTLRAGVARLNRFLEQKGVVESIRSLHHFLCVPFDTRQAVLWFQATQDVIGDCDRFELRSKLRGDIDFVKAMLGSAELDVHDHADDVEAAVYRWLQRWAKLPLIPKLSDDYSFLKLYCSALEELPELEEDDFRALARSLTRSLIDRSKVSISDEHFELFRAFYRSSRRVSFCQFLIKKHGGRLDLLGQHLKEWLLVQLLVGDSEALRRRFTHAIRSDEFSDGLELDQMELIAFIDSIKQKCRGARERFELDWLEDAASTLGNLVGRQLDVQRLAFQNSEELSSLASQLSSESKGAIARAELTPVLEQVTRIIEHCLIVTQSDNDAVEIFYEYFQPLVGDQTAKLVHRSLSRFLLVLSRVAEGRNEIVQARLESIAERITSSHWQAATAPEMSNDFFSSLDSANVTLLFEGLIALQRPSGDEGLRTFVDFIRAEATSGRLGADELSSARALLGPDSVWKRAVPSTVANLLEVTLNDVERSLMLLGAKPSSPSAPSGTQARVEKKLGLLHRTLFLVTGPRIDRLDEEFQIWVAPLIRELMAHEDVASDINWSSLQAELVTAVPNQAASRIESLMYRITGVRSGQQSAGNKLDGFKLFRLAAFQQTLPDDWKTSEPFSLFIEAFRSGLSSGLPIWAENVVKNLETYGDEETAWYESRSILLDKLRLQGYGSVCREFDRLICDIAGQFEGIPASHWIEFFAEGRAYLQFLAIGDVFCDKNEKMSSSMLQLMESLRSFEDTQYPQSDQVASMVQGFGEILLSQRPSMITYDQTRFWLQDVVPEVGQSAAFWRLLMITLRDVCAELVPEEMVVSISSWANRMSTSIESLLAFRESIIPIFDANTRMFAEGKEEDIEWKNAFAGLMVCSVAEEHGRLPRKWLTIQWFETSSRVSRLNLEQWNQVSTLFENKLKDVADPWFMQGLYSVQNTVSERIAARKMDLDETSPDELAFFKRSASGHAKKRWQNYSSIVGLKHGYDQKSFMVVSKHTGWDLRDQRDAARLNSQWGKLLTAARTIDSKNIRLGLLRRQPAPINTAEVDTFRSRLIGVAIGANSEDACCQLQCLFSLKMGPLRAWNFKELLALTERLVGKIDVEQSTETIVAEAWLAAAIAMNADYLADQVVKHWAPYRGTETEESLHNRCRRDLRYLLIQMMQIAVGLSGILALDIWYQRHVLEFIGDKKLEPFSEMVGALDVVLKKELPAPSYKVAKEIAQPLDALLKERTKV